MRRWILDISLAVLLVWSVSILASVLFRSDVTERNAIIPTTTTETEQTQQKMISVLLNGNVREMTQVEYLTGVLLCEIPADFHEQAKQAQAVVARTYAERVTSQGSKHGKGIICADPNCCQGFISPEDYVEKWGALQPVEDARLAVMQTDGIVITYEGKLIDATYFSSSGGMTEGALAVWGADIPYLQPVASPGEEAYSHDLQTVQFTTSEFCRLLGIQEIAGRTVTVSNVTRTSGEGVDTICICGQIFQGTEIRAKLGIRSTNFTISVVSDSVLITTKGFGHRVGMSQYGADAMARAGSSYEQIICHYYQGVTLTRLE